MAILAPVLLLLLLLLLGAAYVGLTRAGVAPRRIFGGMFLVAGVILAIAAWMEAERHRETLAIVEAILASGSLVAGAILVASGPGRGSPPDAF